MKYVRLHSRLPLIFLFPLFCEVKSFHSLLRTLRGIFYKKFVFLSIIKKIFFINYAFNAVCLNRFYNFNKRFGKLYFFPVCLAQTRENGAKKTEEEVVCRYRCRTVRKCSDMLSTEPKACATSHRFFCPFANNARSQSGIHHRATISRQTIRLSRESTTHPPPLTSIVFLLLCTVFLDLTSPSSASCQRARKYNANDRINRSLPPSALLPKRRRRLPCDFRKNSQKSVLKRLKLGDSINHYCLIPSLNSRYYIVLMFNNIYHSFVAKIILSILKS